MKKLFKTLAVFMAALMLITAVDVTAWAKAYRYYDQLTKRQKKIYRQLSKKIDTTKSSQVIIRYNGTEIDGRRSFDALYGDMPYLMQGEQSLYVYKDGGKTYLELWGLLDRKLMKFLKENPTSLELQGENEVMTLLNIHDWVIKNIKYGDEKLGKDKSASQTMSGALTNKTAVCEGYSRTFKYLCDLYDITCVLVMGDAVNENGKELHMWNAVQLDGKWYGVDTTWDDTGDDNWLNYEYFLVGADTEVGGYTFKKNHLQQKKYAFWLFETIKEGFDYPKLNAEAHPYRETLMNYYNPQ